MVVYTWCLTLSGTQGLFLAMHSGITIGRLRGPYRILEIKFVLAIYKASALLTVLSLWSPREYFYNESPVTFNKELFMNSHLCSQTQSWIPNSTSCKKSLCFQAW